MRSTGQLMGEYKKSEGNKDEAFVKLLLLAMLLLPVLVIYFTYVIYGPSWDISVRYIEGKTFINFLTSHVSPQYAFSGEYTENLRYYFEPYREPLTTPIFAFLSLFLKEPILPYQVLLYALYIIAIYFLCKELKIEIVPALAVFVNLYTVFFFFIPNGGEGLAIILLIAGLIYLFRKSAISGLLFGLAGLAKYPAFIALPLVLFLGDKKKMALALILEFAVFIAWGAIDGYLYGTPFSSYLQSLQNAGGIPNSYVISGVSILVLVAYPLIFTAMASSVLKPWKKLRIRLDSKSRILIAFVILSAIGYVAIISQTDLFSQLRYGFVLSFALLIPTAVILNKAVSIDRRLLYASTAVAIIMLVIVVCLVYTASVSTLFGYYPYYNPANSTSAYVHAESELGTLGFNDCKVISNAWVPMLYAGYDTYSPYTLWVTSYGVTPTIANVFSQEGINYTIYITQKREYPILVFKYIGVSPSNIPGLNSTRIAYSDPNLTIYMPKNATCYKSYNAT